MHASYWSLATLVFMTIVLIAACIFRFNLCDPFCPRKRLVSRYNLVKVTLQPEARSSFLKSQKNGDGIGKGIAKKLVECGANVVALDVSQDSLDLLSSEIPKIKTVTVDLCNWQSTKDAVRSVLPVDLLVNNAGVGITGPLEQVTEEKFDKIFDVNVKAVVNVTQTVIEDLVKRKLPGSIVNISSQASKAALSNHSLYCATKAAIDGFTRVIALDYGNKNIRINCVNPTVVMTDLGRQIWSDPAVKKPMLEKIPLKRFAEVDDVVDAVLFLLSDKANMITGSCLPVDGGFLAC